LNWLISTALRLRVLVIAGAVLLLAGGFRLLHRTPLDVFPEFALPTVEIQTEAPGLSSEEVETLVTLPLENALNGAPWLETLRSKSVLGLSSVVLLFAEGTDLPRARQMVQERLAVAAPRLPAVAKPPVILQPLSSTSRVLKIGMWSRKLSQVGLTDLAKWTVRPRLMAVPGVANVAVWGERDRQLQVIVDPDQLAAHEVSLEEVERAARDAVALASGGFVDTPNQRLSVRHRPAVRSAQDLKSAVVAHRGGSPLLLGAVASVVEGHPPPIGDAVVNDGPGLLLIVEKHPWGNTLDVTRGVEAAIESLRPGLGDVELDATIFRPATFIERSLGNLRQALLGGCALVIVVLLLFLYDLRTAIISMAAIPLSLLAAAVVLYSLGGTVNTMVLAGLVIATGEVVDDAIIDVENIARRLRLNYALPQPRSAFHVVLSASIEVRSAVVVASLIVVLVFLPLFFLEGLAGTFFRPLAFAYVLAIAASLFVALTVTPACCLVLLPRMSSRRGESPLVVRLKAAYRSLLPGILARPRAVIALVLAALALSVAGLRLLGEEFLPDFKETDFVMHWLEKPGTSVEAVQRITVRVSKELRAIPGVRNFGAHIGRAEVADEVVGPDFAELWISVEEGVDHAATVAKIQEVVDGYPGLYRDVLTYLKERIKEVLTGTSAAIVVRIFGPDLETLRAKAHEVERAIRGDGAGRTPVAGVVDLKVESQVLVPHVEVRLLPEAAALHGLTAGEVRRTTSTLLKGTKVGEVYDEQKVRDVVVWGDPRLRTDLSALRRLPLETRSGARPALGEVASVAIVPTPNQVRREGASRRIDVTCNVRGRDLGSVANEIEALVRSVSFEPGYHPEVLGEYQAREESQRRLLVLCGSVLAAIFVVLYADFQSLRLALLVFFSLPFALIGGVLGAAGGGGVLSMGSLIGFVTVLGIAARNGILLVSHLRHLEEVEGEPFGPGLVLRGAEERLSPILMTALCASLALLPLAVAGKVPGHEIEHPMALVILGGLGSSTALNLLVMPALYLRFARARVGETTVAG
jgi:CzcA family heavy metal efflux pump